MVEHPRPHRFCAIGEICGSTAHLSGGSIVPLAGFRDVKDRLHPARMSASRATPACAGRPARS